MCHCAGATQGDHWQPASCRQAQGPYPNHTHKHTLFYAADSQGLISSVFLESHVLYYRIFLVPCLEAEFYEDARSVPDAAETMKSDLAAFQAGLMSEDAVQRKVQKHMAKFEAATGASEAESRLSPPRAWMTCSRRW